jgi:nitrogenase molybdenum-cofactor synthesis protein NifE
MGYVGMVELVAEIDKAIYNPMWEQLRKPAPWEQEGANWQSRAIAQADAEAAALAADPMAAEAARRAKKVCHCKSIDLGTIEDAIAAHGITTVEGVRERTSASGGCGACAGRVDDVLARMNTPATLLQAAE